MGLWNFVSDVGKGFQGFGAMPFRVGYRILQTGYKTANFFTDISQELVHDVTAGKLEDVPVAGKYLKFLSDDEYEGSVLNAIEASVNDNVLGDSGVVAKTMGPRGIGGEVIRAFPEWFLRDQARGPVQAGAKGLDMVYRQAIQRPVGTAITVANMAGITPSANPLNIALDIVTNAGDFTNVYFDTSSWTKAWEISNKQTMGQAIAHGLLTADVNDPDQIREMEETALFSLLSGTADLGLVFYADPTKALMPVVRTARLVQGTKGATLHTMGQTHHRWNPVGEGGMFGPEGVVGSRYKITPEEFVETPRVQRVLDVIDEHAADIDFAPEHSVGFNGPQPLTLGDTIRRMPDRVKGELPPEAQKVQTLAGRLMNDRRLSKLAGWTPDLAQALAIAPDAVTRKFVLRLAMGDTVAREAVENAMRTWVETQASGTNFRSIREMQDALAATPELSGRTVVNEFGETVRVSEEALRSRTAALQSGIEGATQQAIRELIEANPANAGSLFQVAYAMGHNQMGALARTADDMLRADIPIAIREAAGDATLTTAANDFVLAGLFSEADNMALNRTLFSTLADPPAIAVRRDLGRSVMNVVEPRLSFSVGNRTFSPRRIIEVTREAVADHIMDFQNVDGAWRNWNAMVREAGRIENGEVLRLAMKKLKIDGDADTLVGLWQTKSLSGRKTLFYDLRTNLAEAYVENFSHKIDPELLKRAGEFTEIKGRTKAEYINYLLFNIKGKIKDAEDQLHTHAVKARQFGTGDGAILDGDAGLGVSYRRNLPMTPAHLEQSAVIPRYSYVKNLETKNSLTNGIRFVNGWADLAMTGWKKSVLLRPGWPLRVLTDEELRAVATVGFESQLAGIGQGLLDYRTELTRMRGIDSVTPAIEEITGRLQKQIDEGIIELPEGVSKADQLAPDELFDLTGAEVVNEIFESTTKRLLKESNRTRRIVWGIAGLGVAGPVGALAAAGLYSRTARKTMQTSAIREAAEYFGFQMREVNVQDLMGEIDTITQAVKAGRLSPETGAQQITDLRHAAELLENQVATLDEVLDMLHPEMSDQYAELLNNFDRSGLLMQDAGYQGFMVGPYGAKNVFGDDPFEIEISRRAASSDNGRRALTQASAQQRAVALAQEYGDEPYQVFNVNNPEQAGTFAAKWDDTVNRQWTPTEGVPVDEMLGDFQTYIKNLWRLSDDEMVGWLESKRGTEFSEAFSQHYLDKAGEASSANLIEWVQATRLEVDSILPDFRAAQWSADFQPSRSAVDAFDALRDKASKGERLSWDKDVMPVVRQMADESGENSLFGNKLSPNEVISKVREGTGSNFGHIVSHSGIGQDLATATVIRKFINGIDNAMFKLGTASVNHLSRNPLWKALYAKHGARRVQPFRNADGNYTMTPRQHYDAMQAAKRESLKEMRDLLYELGKRTRFQEVVGNLSPFFGAYQEVISKWAGIAVRNPVFVARGTRYYGLANDEDNRIFLDLTDLFDNEVAEKVINGIPYAGWIQPMLANQAVTVNPGSIMIWNASPGVNPGASFVLGEIAIKEPSLGEMFTFFQPYGASESSSRFMRALESVAPTIIKRLPVAGTSNYNKMTGLIAQDVIGQMIRDGRFIDLDNFDSIGAELTEEVKRRTQQVMALHAVAGAALPVSIAVTSPDYKLMEAYRKVESALGFEKAVIWLLETYPDYWNIARRRTQLRNGVAAYTKAGSALKEQHERFANANPKIGDFVLGEVGAEDTVSTFSYHAYVSALAEGNTERLDALETLKNNASSVGWVEYRARIAPVQQALLTKFDAGDTRSMSYNAKGNEVEKAQRDIILNDLRSKYPGWFDDYQSSQGNTVLRGVLASFTTLVNEHATEFDYRPEVKYIRDYLAERFLIQEELRDRPNKSLRNDANADLYTYWVKKHIEWGRNETFGSTLVRYFNNDFISPDSWMNVPPEGLG
jgi:hypothetical protein